MKNGAILGLLALAVVAAGAGGTQAGDGEPPWAEILGPAQGKWPGPTRKVFWRSDLERAFAQARKQDRPLFVTLRCLPCEQCADFDKDLLEGGPELDPLLRQFVTVRLTTMRGLDGRLFPFEGFQDLDLSWWGWFLSPEGEVYGVYGGRDEVSDTTRISIPSLRNVMRRVLDHHYDPRRERWDVDGPAPVLDGRAASPESLPGWKSWASRGFEEAGQGECLHCHQVSEILRQPAIDAGTFDKRDFYVWPFPENVGLRLDRDHGLRVEKVETGSPADRAGLKAGDVLGAAGRRRLFGQADLRGVLHRAGPGPTALELVWTREGEVSRGRLELSAGWRETDLSWRLSVVDADFGGHPGFAWCHPVPAPERAKRGIPQGTLAVTPWFGRGKPRGPAYEAGLRPDDVIVAVDGESPDLAGRPFMVWFRLRFDAGQRVELTVANGEGRRRELRYVLSKGFR